MHIVMGIYHTIVCIQWYGDLPYQYAYCHGNLPYQYAYNVWGITIHCMHIGMVPIPYMTFYGYWYGKLPYQYAYCHGKSP